jgi:hypothetical protein
MERIKGGSYYTGYKLRTALSPFVVYLPFLLSFLPCLPHLLSSSLPSFLTFLPLPLSVLSSQYRNTEEGRKGKGKGKTRKEGRKEGKGREGKGKARKEGREGKGGEGKDKEGRKGRKGGTPPPYRLRRHAKTAWRRSSNRLSCFGGTLWR